jgi:two-component system, LuxR family, response regulator FixJ
VPFCRSGIARPIDLYQSKATADVKKFQIRRSKGVKCNMPQQELAGSFPVIAIVDDDPAVCNSLKFSLELEGFAVRTYRSGAEFLGAGNFRDCSCFIIDQRMPGMSGMELIAELRGRNVSTPAILIISQLNKVLSTRAAEARVPIIEKPFLNNGLVDKIREVCAGV